MSATDITHPRDSFGLPKIDIGPGGDETQRDHSRAPLMSGGTITGNSYQTSPTDPRIVIDSNALTAHKADGTQTVRIDVNTGYVSFLSSAASSGGILFVDTTGTTVARIVDDPTILSGGLTMETLNDNLQVISNAGTFGGGALPIAGLSLFGPAGSATLQSAGTNHTAAVALTGGNPARISNQVADSGVLEAFDFVIGGLVMSNINAQRELLCAKAAFTCTFGMRFVAAAAANIFSVYDQYRQVRGNTNGAIVTPGAFTQTTVVTNTNVASTSVSVVRGEGAMFNISPTAAGVCIAVEVWTAS